jgi:hypothetical protein
MEDVRIVLSALWVATMLTYLLGDVLRIFSGDAMKMFAEQEAQVTQIMWLVMAIIMVIPTVMVFLSVALQYLLNRWANIIVALLFLGFSLFQVNSYPGAYDRFLLIVSMGFNVLTVWYAWNWA